MPLESVFCKINVRVTYMVSSAIVRVFTVKDKGPKYYNKTSAIYYFPVVSLFEDTLPETILEGE
jgi:hypothetical protein